PVTCAQKKRVFLCAHGSLTDPAAMRAGRVKSRSKKLCKFVHYCATEKEGQEERKAAFKRQLFRLVRD
ncbi:TPA: hypothetical protein ACH74A_004939, partial [Escherichia coli]